MYTTIIVGIINTSNLNMSRYALYPGDHLEVHIVVYIIYTFFNVLSPSLEYMVGTPEV